MKKSPYKAYKGDKMGSPLTQKYDKTGTDERVYKVNQEKYDDWNRKKNRGSGPDVRRLGAKENKSHLDKYEKYKAYKGDRMPSALPQKNKSGKKDEDRHQTLEDVANSKLNAINKGKKSFEIDIEAGGDKKKYYDDQMSFSKDSIKDARTTDYNKLVQMVKDKKMTMEEAKKHTAVTDKKPFTDWTMNK
tara:strand:- start:57 stop:623 length:567 start_codon:yes stop_codon:yes gene_type:complete